MRVHNEQMPDRKPEPATLRYARCNQGETDGVRWLRRATFVALGLPATIITVVLCYRFALWIAGVEFMSLFGTVNASGAPRAIWPVRIGWLVSNWAAGILLLDGLLAISTLLISIHTRQRAFGWLSFASLTLVGAGLLMCMQIGFVLAGI